VNIADLPAYLRALQDAAAKAAAPAADAMAGTVRDRVANVTLRQTAHPPGMFWKAARGRPPAYASGNLARSILTTPASGLVRATASAGAYAQYAAVQEWGGHMRGRPLMHWVNSRGPWWMRSVTVPEHPFFEPTVSHLIATGELSRAARDAFWARISLFFR
jgi:phage gpG-like protein